MQDYTDIARKNGTTLIGSGSCQFCGADTARGVHECVELFSLGFDVLDYSKPANHEFRFLSVDAHTLQHPEIHGRWNNHFHLTRQHLMLQYQVAWNYELSPKLSDHLNRYKSQHKSEFLEPPAIGQRGAITTTDVLSNSSSEDACRELIKEWARVVYDAWSVHHATVDRLAVGFMNDR